MVRRLLNMIRAKIRAVRSTLQMIRHYDLGMIRQYEYELAHLQMIHKNDVDLIGRYRSDLTNLQTKYESDLTNLHMKRENDLEKYQSDLARLQTSLSDVERHRDSSADIIRKYENDLANQKSKYAEAHRLHEIELAKFRETEISLSRVENGLLTEKIMRANCAAALRDYQIRTVEAEARLASSQR